MTTENRSHDKEDEATHDTQMTENHDDNTRNYDEINCEYCCNIFHQSARETCDPTDPTECGH